MGNTANLSIIVRARDQASRQLEGIGGGARRLLGFAATAATAGAVALAGFGVASVLAANSFQTAFAEVTTLFDAPIAQVEALKQGVLDLSSTMGLDAVETTKALYQAISAGVAPANALAFIEQNAKLAIGGVTDLATAVDLTTTVLNAFGMAESELTRVTDVLFTGVRLGKTTVAELGQAMFNVAPIAAASGVSIENVTAALASLTASGTPTSEATTQLRQVFAELGKEGTAVDKVFQDIAGVGFRQFMAEGNDLADVMEVLQRAAEDQDVAISDLFGSIEAGGAAQVLAGQGFESLVSNLGDMEDAVGATDAAYEKMNATFGRQFDILKSKLQVIMIEVGLRILPGLTVAVTAAADAFEWATEKADPLVHLFQVGFAGGTIGGEFSAAEQAAFDFGAVLSNIGDWVRDHREDIVAGLEAFGLGLDGVRTAAVDLGTWLIDNQAVLVTAIVAIGVAFAWTNPLTFALIGAGGLVFALGVTKQSIDDQSLPMLKMRLAVRELQRAVLEFAIDFLTVGGIFDNFIGEKIPGLGGVLQGLHSDLDTVNDDIDGTQSAIRGWDNLNLGPNSPLAQTVSYAQDLANQFGLARTNAELLLLALANFGSGATVGDVAASLEDGGYGPQARAHGGPVSAGRLYRVGEREDEYFIPAANGRIVPASARGARSGGWGDTFNFSGSVVLGGRATRDDAKNFIDWVEDEWRERRRRRL